MEALHGLTVTLLVTLYVQTVGLVIYLGFLYLMIFYFIFIFNESSK